MRQCEPTHSHILTGRGYEFSLGKENTAQVKVNFQQDYEFTEKLVEIDVENWPKKST